MAEHIKLICIDCKYEELVEISSDRRLICPKCGRLAVLPCTKSEQGIAYVIPTPPPVCGPIGYGTEQDEPEPCLSEETPLTEMSAPPAVDPAAERACACRTACARVGAQTV